MGVKTGASRTPEVVTQLVERFDRNRDASCSDRRNPEEPRSDFTTPAKTRPWIRKTYQAVLIASALMIRSVPALFLTNDSPQSSAASVGITVAEIGAAAVSVGLLAGTGALVLGSSPVLGVTLFVTAPAGAAVGTYLMGRWLDPSGSLVWSGIGTYGGALGGGALGIAAGIKSNNDFFLYALPVAGVCVGAVAGAVLGYKLSRRHEDKSRLRFAPPSIGLLVRHAETGKTPPIQSVHLDLLRVWY